jgi:RNA-directed DNA polymerase (reverse transcriptase)
MYPPSEVTNDERLAGILRCSVELLPILISKCFPFDDTLCFVRQKKVPKRNKKLGFRMVYKIDLTPIEYPIKAFKFYLNNLYEPLECVHGFVSGKNIVSNATAHLSQDRVLNIDIENFFESIYLDKVSKSFERFGFIPSIAHKLAKISTYEDRLVAGFPTSPTIANIVCIDMDNAIMEFCRIRDLAYTRYADDISISGKNVEVLKDVEAIINSFGFKLNNKKTRLFKKGQSQYVTGLTVSDYLFPRIPRRFKNRLRQRLYYMEKYSIFSHIEREYDCQNESELLDYCRKELNHIKGWIDFIHSIEPLLAKKYYFQ